LEYWDGFLYCGITLKWNYSDDMTNKYVDISMPGYIKKTPKIQSSSTPKPVHLPFPTPHEPMVPKYKNQPLQMIPHPLVTMVKN
jgi:hypothetical protein